MKTFRTRREQIETEFLATCLKTPTRKVIKAELKGAAMVGACEERDRVLTIIRGSWCLTDAAKRDLIDAIISKGVLDVLGYEAKKAGATR
jgi:hypothetical protein